MKHHESLKVKKFTLKEDAGFRVRVEQWEVLNPKGLFAVDIIQECFDRNGEVDFTSTYNFHMTKDEIKTLCEGLMA